MLIIKMKNHPTKTVKLLLVGDTRSGWGLNPSGLVTAIPTFSMHLLDHRTAPR